MAEEASGASLDSTEVEGMDLNVSLVSNIYPDFQGKAQDQYLCNNRSYANVVILLKTLEVRSQVKI